MEEEGAVDEDEEDYDEGETFQDEQLAARIDALDTRETTPTPQGTPQGTPIKKTAGPAGAPPGILQKA